ncbi:MAG: OmpA family protein [Kiritimatiellae bacterium]|nr:OmpA family protein [Kiritimatiellia bacterium]
MVRDGDEGQGKDVMVMARAIRWCAVLMAAALVVGGGCRSRPKAGAAGDSGVNPLGVAPVQVGAGEVGMTGEPFSGTERRGAFQPVYFAYDSSAIESSERSKIEAVADALRAAPSKRLIIEGHCDERGSNEYNLALGERRALAIRAYLIGLGIAADRIQTKSFGEEQPVAFGHNEEAWRLNRRGEFVIIE